ncbi:hypothetical protein HDU93_009234 [Gonapodya sp. JEL0774]|nr:hypothetical protein HDU93_009234 [Gonapodya sp. JEL0774]
MQPLSWIPQAAFTLGVVATAYGTALYLDARELVRKDEDVSLRSLIGLPSTKTDGPYFRRDSRYPESVIERIPALLRAEWDRLSRPERTVGAIIAANSLVYLAWQVRPFQSFMAKSFLHYPLSGRSYTMLTSAFSQMSIGHFAFNMIALWSFGTGEQNVSVSEQV